MPSPDLALLGVFAHPDDEGSCSGCLARYATEGMRVYVACTTRGDGVDAQIKDALKDLICRCGTHGAAIRAIKRATQQA